VISHFLNPISPLKDGERASERTPSSSKNSSIIQIAIQLRENIRIPEIN